MRLLHILIAAVLLFAACAMAADKEKPMATDKNPVELTKQEALDVMNLQFAAISMEADLKNLYAQRDHMIQGLMTKYDLKAEDWQVDLKTGRLVPKPKKEEATNAKAQ